MALVAVAVKQCLAIVVGPVRFMGERIALPQAEMVVMVLAVVLVTMAAAVVDPAPIVHQAVAVQVTLEDILIILYLMVQCIHQIIKLFTHKQVDRHIILLELVVAQRVEEAVQVELLLHTQVQHKKVQVEHNQLFHLIEFIVLTVQEHTQVKENI